jgi:hypothetical protein
LLASLAATVLVVLAPREAPAQNAPIYRWCMQPSARWGPDCYYTTIDQCRATAAAIGFCYENPAYTVAMQRKPQRMPR